jgi:hypothetical protein
LIHSIENVENLAFGSSQFSVELGKILLQFQIVKGRKCAVMIFNAHCQTDRLAFAEGAVAVDEYSILPRGRSASSREQLVATKSPLGRLHPEAFVSRGATTRPVAVELIPRKDIPKGPASRSDA